MSKFKERVYNVDEFSNKEYAELLKMKTEDAMATTSSWFSLVIVLYTVTIALIAVPFFVNVPGWVDSIITFVTPITYIASFALQVLTSHKIMAVMLGAAFSAGLDMDKPPMDMIVGALYAVLTIFIFIACPPVAISNQIKKDKLIIQAADKVLSAPDQIV